MLKDVGRLGSVTYRVLSKSTLGFSKSFQALDFFANAAFQLGHLLWCAGNTRNPSFEGGIFNLACRHAVLQFELLDCREEVEGLDLMTDGAFDPESVNRTRLSTDRAVIDTHFRGSL